jgi:hypothetical protein
MHMTNMEKRRVLPQSQLAETRGQMREPERHPEEIYFVDIGTGVERLRRAVKRCQVKKSRESSNP